MSAQSPVTAVERSDNAKLGNVSATYASQATCPSDCPWLGKGCYAEMGYAGFTTSRLNRSTEQDADRIAELEADAIDSLSGNRPMRIHVVGDATTNKAARTLGRAAGRYSKRGKTSKGKKVWSYTHASHKVKRASWGKHVSVLASCETTQQAKDAMERGYAAAVVVTAFKQQSAYVQDGVKLLPCPSQTKGTKCSDCRLCLDDDRLRESGLVIAFEAHGARKNMVRQTLMSLPTV